MRVRKVAAAPHGLNWRFFEAAAPEDGIPAHLSRAAPSQNPFPYRKDIDGLRSIAVLLVLLFHFELGRFFRAGFFGVDIFFVISGFLIGSILRLQIRQKSFEAKTFYVRRIRRLAPPLLVTIALTFALAYFLMTPQELERVGDEATSAQLYLSNVYFWRFLSYFGLQAGESPFLHTWSLAVEEQFYLLFPAMIYATFKWRGKLVSVLVLVLIASFALNLVGVLWKPEATFYLLPTRAWEFASGALIPDLILLAVRWRLPSGAIAAMGLVGLLASLLSYRENFLFPGWFALLPVASTVALLVAGSKQDSWYSQIMSTRLPVYLGRISYELYLVHWPIRVFAPLLIFDYSLSARIFCFLLCMPIAACIYHSISMPIRRGNVLRNQASILSSYAICTCLLVTFSIVVRVTHGLPSRMNNNVAQFANAANDLSLKYRDCENQAIGNCRIGAVGRTPDWLVYGDSHADALAPAFDAFLRGRRAAAYFAFKSGCLPVYDSGDANCRRFNADVFKFLSSHPAVHAVTLVSTWRQPIEPHYTDRTGMPVSGSSALDAFRNSLNETIETYQRTGHRVIVWLPVPGARKSVPGALARNALLHRNWDVRFTREEYDRTFAFLFEDLKQLRITSIQPAKYVCASGECEILYQNRPLYHDDAHPAASQSVYFRHIIEAELNNQPSF